ncbi:MAG: multicopper oxidase domain-containing protein, partial [Nocardioides sp.]
FGVLMARGIGDPLHVQMMLAHAAVNLLGWMGLTVVGTLVTLWPTMLRTRIAEGSERAAQRALPVLVGAVAVTVVGALAGQRLVAAAGLATYLGGLILVARPFVAAARGKAPAHFPTWSVLAGVSWLAGCVGFLSVAVGTAGSWHAVHDRVEVLTPALAAGFGAQVLVGALSFLIPVALGGGPTPVRAANAALDRAAPLRVALVNAGLLACLLPVPPLARVLASVLALVGLASFLPLLFLAMRASRRAKASAESPPATRPRGPAPVSAERTARRSRRLAGADLAAVLLAVAAGVAFDSTGLAGDPVSAAAGVPASGETRTVQVEAQDMRFVPDRIEVPAGTRLLIEVTNADDGDVHDLVLDTGDDTGRLAPGESATLDVGVVGRDLDGWCSVLGHRRMGMVLAVDVAGGPAAAADHGTHQHGAAAAPSTAAPEAAVPEVTPAAREATLPELPSGRVHRRTLTVTEVQREVAPGVTQTLWTYNGSAPGPVLRGRVGDTFEITLVNDGSIGHSVDFHAGALAPDRPMRTIPPGESLTYRFTAERAGIWMYHCSSMLMSAHIANGMFGAVVVEPRDLPRVDRSYLLVQSEHYYGEDSGVVDLDKLAGERPDAVVFNGYANQYDAHPLAARAGERVRVWVLDAGPNRSTSFHVVGAQFDTVFAEGAYLLKPGEGGAQSLALAAAQGGFVELSFPEPGRYPFVSHVMVDAERGAHGVFAVR